MKRFVKLTALILALLLLASMFISCKLPDQASKPVNIETQETQPADTPAPTAVSTPSFEVSTDAASAFDALDLDTFRWFATRDGYSFHMYIDDPSKFGIDPTTVPMTLGEFTEEDSLKFTQDASVFLDRINAINREQLPQAKQFPYDVLHDLLEDYALDTAEYEYMYEPLTEYSGIHSNLPLSFALFELKNTRDIEDYLTLLADMPRYMGQILAYEQKRAELGMFMTKDALNAILKQCKSTIDSRDNSFLYATFNDAIDQLTSLTPEQAQTYKDRNASLIKNEYIDSFKSLYDGLYALRTKCRSYEQAATHSEIEKRYFEYSMQDAGCNSLSAEETLEMLKAELNYLLYDSVGIEIYRPNIRDMGQSLPNGVSSGNTQTDLDYLQSVISSILPELPEHTLSIVTVPEELQDQFSPAAYVIPALDDWKQNTIYINTETEDPTLLLTLAHEGYPGHMYQYVYQRGLDNVGLMQRTANFGAYAEGWAQFAEFLVTEYQKQYDEDYVRYLFEYGIYSNSILPAIVSILVNYYGYSEKAIESYITGLGLNGDEVASDYYKMVIDQPYYFFEYAIGYAQLAQLYRSEMSDLGGSFHMNEFLKTYLNLGPGNFDLIKEQMYVWLDARLQDDV